MSRDPLLYLDELIEAAERACEFGNGLARGGCQPGSMAFEAIVPVKLPAMLPSLKTLYEKRS
jgi:hypothetical protein